MFISVDLPQPLGPKIETILPRGRSRLKLVYSGLPAKLLLRPRTVTCVFGAARSVSSESGSVGQRLHGHRGEGKCAAHALPLQWISFFSPNRNSRFSR